MPKDGMRSLVILKKTFRKGDPLFAILRNLKILAKFGIYCLNLVKLLNIF